MVQKAFFLHLLNILLLNSYNLFLIRTGKKTPFRKFSYHVIFQLLQKHGKICHSPRPRMSQDHLDRIEAHTYISKHFLQYLHPLGGRKTSQKQCFVCMPTSRREKKCKIITTECKECSLAMC